MKDCHETSENIQNFFCAGDGLSVMEAMTEPYTPDSCHGDSGGPLTCKVGDKWVSIKAAILSFITRSKLRIKKFKSFVRL